MSTMSRRPGIFCLVLCATNVVLFVCFFSYLVDYHKTMSDLQKSQEKTNSRPSSTTNGTAERNTSAVTKKPAVKESDTKRTLTLKQDSPIRTAYRELVQRRKKGCLENVLLKFLINETRVLKGLEPVCKSPLPMIALVQSACQNEKRRQVIRETWAKESRNMNVPVVFFVGRCPSARREMETYRDVVEVDFVDSYYNNTLKSLARYRWYNEHCSNADLVLMIDDDVLANVNHILIYLPNPIDYTIRCLKFTNSVVLRQTGSKWYVPHWALRDQNYPPYCAGFAYVVNGTAMLPLFEASLEVPYIHIDDALFTGYAAEMVGVERISEPRITVRKEANVNCNSGDLFASHGFSADDMKKQWLKRKAKCKS